MCVCVFSGAHLVGPPLELLAEGDGALQWRALLVQVGLALAAGGAALGVEGGAVQPAALPQPQHRLALPQQLRVAL